MTALPGVSLPLELAGVDHRHHGRHDDQLAGVSFPLSIIGTGTAAGEAPALARSMTSLPRLGTLANVDRRHHGRHDDQLAGVSFPPSIVNTTGTAAR